jgi:hypothetical protein
LGERVRVHERVLTAAVPEVEDTVAQEAHMALPDVDGRAEVRGERGGGCLELWSVLAIGF